MEVTFQEMLKYRHNEILISIVNGMISTLILTRAFHCSCMCSLNKLCSRFCPGPGIQVGKAGLVILKLTTSYT